MSRQDSHRYYHYLQNEKKELKQYMNDHQHLLSSHLKKQYEHKIFSMTVKMLVIDNKNEFIINQLKAVV